PRPQRLGALRNRRERVAAHEHRVAEIIRRRVDVAPGQLILVGERDGVDEKIERAPFRRKGRERRVDRGRLGHIAMTDDQPADFLRERLDPPFECLALVSEGELGALAMAGLCDAPREGAVVGNTQDQAPFAAQEARRFRHDLPRWPATASLPMTQGKRPHKQPPLVATSAPAAAGISLGAKCWSVWYR